MGIALLMSLSQRGYFGDMSVAIISLPVLARFALCVLRPVLFPVGLCLSSARRLRPSGEFDPSRGDFVRLLLIFERTSDASFSERVVDGENIAADRRRLFRRVFNPFLVKRDDL